MTLNIITPKLIIEGVDRIDFAQMKKGEKYEMFGDFKIKNLYKFKMIDIEIPKKAKMIHTHITSSEIPIEVASSVSSGVNKSDKIVTMYVRATTSPNQQIGDYEGQIQITVTLQ